MPPAGRPRRPLRQGPPAVPTGACVSFRVRVPRLDSGPSPTRHTRRRPTRPPLLPGGTMNPTATRGIAPVTLASLPEYAPTTYVDFSKPDHRAAFEKALAEVKARFGAEHPIVIGGERVKGSGTFD